MSIIEEHLQEDVLNLPKHKVKELFAHKAFLNSSSSSTLVDMFQRDGTYTPRSAIESDLDKVQALPIVVVRNSSGQILLLRRREKVPDSPLHEKIVIWAGGHVRREDSVDGKPISQCLSRELEEELRLRIVPEDVILLGSVYIDDGASAKHVAIVYEWRVKTDDVEVALSNSEFFERRGTSLSGKFVSVDALREEIKNGKKSEPWSDYILSEFLAKDTKYGQAKLL